MNADGIKYSPTFTREQTLKLGKTDFFETIPQLKTHILICRIPVTAFSKADIQNSWIKFCFRHKAAIDKAIAL